jgi:Rieske Fe-S protein
VQALTRRSFICAGAAVAALTALPAVAATGVKTLKNGKTVIDLAANKTLTEVGGLIELSIKKYGKVAVVRTSKSANGFSVINLACPHAGVLVSKSSEGWSCNPPGHGSVFALNGALKVGPASSPLKSIKFTATSKALTIN